MRAEKTGQVIYVGKGRVKQGGSQRLFWHWQSLRNGEAIGNDIFARVLNKHLSLGIEPEICIVQWFETEQEAFSHERTLISRYGRRKFNQGTLCNLTEGGEGVEGLKMSPATRQKLRDLAKAQWARPGFRERIMRFHASEEVKAMRSAVSKRMWEDPEYRAKTLKALQASVTPTRRKRQSDGVKAAYAKWTPEALSAKGKAARACRGTRNKLSVVT